jgi:cellobiose phosphorylase
VINPVIPPEWDGFEIRYQSGETNYLIRVNNPGHVAQNIKRVELDGILLAGVSIPLAADHRDHKVIVTMGKKTR